MRGVGACAHLGERGGIVELSLERLESALVVELGSKARVKLEIRHRVHLRLW